MTSKSRRGAHSANNSSQALEYILVEQQVELASELEPDLLRVMNSDNGNHVVQKILTKLPRERIDFVYDAVRGRVAELSQQPYACRVIQRMIEKGTAADKAFILKEFHEVAKKLATHQWGNYVVQAVIKHGGDEARAKVIRLCLDQFFTFSKEKVASNVMEHCILYGTEGDRLAMYRLLTHQAEDGSSLLQAMWKDQFANYVVRKSSLRTPPPKDPRSCRLTQSRKTVPLPGRGRASCACQSEQAVLRSTQETRPA